MSQNLHDDFMSLGDMSDIDNRILAEAGQDDLIDRMTAQKEKDAARKAPWMQQVKENWFLYALLGISFLLTETLAVYLGMAPAKMTDLTGEITGVAGQTYIHFNNDLGHLFTTLVYMLVFPIVTELAFDHFRKLFNQRETGNFQQALTSSLAVVVSVISWVGTGVAGAYVILSTLGSLGFLEVPPAVQKYIIWIVPLLLAFFAVTHWLYESGSKLAKSQKMADEQEKTAELADRVRMQQIERAGNRAMKAAAIRAYEEAIARGLLSPDQARDAISRGKSLAQLETELKRDLTGEGLIGNISGLSRPALVAPSACEYCGTQLAKGAAFCASCGSPTQAKTRPGIQPEDTTSRPGPIHADREPLYHPVSLEPRNGSSKPGPTHPPR